MHIIKVDKSNEKSFLAYVKEKKHENFLIWMDYKLNPEHNHLFMAINENQKIQGIFQVLFGQIQLRGSKEAVETFIKYLMEQYIEIQEISGTLLHEDVLNQYFPAPKMKVNKYCMIFSKENKQIYPQFKFQKLEGNEETKEKIASLIREADPKHWGGVKSNHLVVDKTRPYFAIMGDNGEILSIAGLWFDETIGLVNVVATHPISRKKGYATSILSSSVDWLSQRTEKIIIDARTDNTPAIRIYQKLGFNIGYEFLIITIE